MRSWTIAALLAAIVMAAFVRAPTLPNTTLVPGFLIGTWRTSSETHEDTYLRLTSTGITFGTFEGTREHYAVTSVIRSDDGFGPRYTIHYRDLEGDAQRISLYFEDRVLRLANQRLMEWTWSRY